MCWNVARHAIKEQIEYRKKQDVFRRTQKNTQKGIEYAKQNGNDNNNNNNCSKRESERPLLREEE